MIDLNTKQKLGIVAGYSVLLIACTYYFSPTKIKIETKTVEIVKTVEVEKKDTAKDRKRKLTIIEKKESDGSSEKTTVITDDTSSNTSIDIAKDTTDSKAIESSKVTERATDKVTISALAGANPFKPTDGLVYGGSITKPLLGPIAGGLFGMSNGVVGASVGLTF